MFGCFRGRPWATTEPVRISICRLCFAAGSRRTSTSTHPLDGSHSCPTRNTAHSTIYRTFDDLFRHSLGFRSTIIFVGRRYWLFIKQIDSLQTSVIFDIYLHGHMLAQLQLCIHSQYFYSEVTRVTGVSSTMGVSLSVGTSEPLPPYRFGRSSSDFDGYGRCCALRHIRVNARKVAREAREIGRFSAQ
jgi:hypothetical protein